MIMPTCPQCGENLIWKHLGAMGIEIQCHNNTVCSFSVEGNGMTLTNAIKDFYHKLDLLEPKCWCGKPATITCVTCLVDLCSKHSEDEHILRKHETHNIDCI